MLGLRYADSIAKVAPAAREAGNHARQVQDIVGSADVDVILSLITGNGVVGG